MLAKAALFIFSIASLISFTGHAVEEGSEDNILSCRDCKTLACCEQESNDSEEIKTQG